MSRFRNILKKASALAMSAVFLASTTPISNVFAAGSSDKFTCADYANHWGRSDIRAYYNNALVSDAENAYSGTGTSMTISGKNYKVDSTGSTNSSGFAQIFTDDEYGRLKDNTVETNVLANVDGKPKAVNTYMTTDKLIFPSGNNGKNFTYLGEKDISDGTIYQQVLKAEDFGHVVPISYWACTSRASDSYTWLRSPYFNNLYLALIAYRGSRVSSNSCLLY